MVQIIKNNMKKVAFINIFKGSHGGGEIYLKRLINNLHGLISDKSYLITPECPALDNCNITIKQIYGIKISGNNTIKDYYKLIVQIRHILNADQPDIVVVNGDRAIALSFLFGVKRDIIGIKHMLINNRCKKLINYIGFHKLSTIITISNFHKQNFIKWFGNKLQNKIKIIYNSVDPDIFDSKFKLSQKKIRFIEVASIEKRKGQEDLIHAFHALKKKYNDIELYFYGTGPDLNLCKNLVNALGIRDVFFEGFIDNISEVYKNYPAVFILPSYDEGLPISILEAMSSGLPVITTNIAGIPEVIIDGKNGKLINPGDISGLYTKMEFFILNKHLINEYGQQGRLSIINKFNRNGWICEWRKILQ